MAKLFSNIHPPVPYVTAPVGHGERFPRNPFGRFALRALFLQPPVPYGTAPVGHGERFPRNPFGRFAPKPVIFRFLSSKKNRAVPMTGRPVFIFIDHPLFGDRLVFRRQGFHRGPAKDVGNGTEAEDDEVACRFALKAKETKIRLTGIDK